MIVAVVFFLFRMTKEVIIIKLFVFYSVINF